MHWRMEMCKGVEEAVNDELVEGEDDQIQVHKKIDVWKMKKEADAGRSEMDLLPLMLHHLHPKVVDQVGQGGGLKVPHKYFH